MAIAKAYDDLIMDHIKNARGYHELAQPTHSAKGTNPLCGDEITVYLRIADDRVVETAYQCACCGICMASASIMTESVSGANVGEARQQLKNVLSGVAAAADAVSGNAPASQLALFRTALEFPARTRCAMLPWMTLEAALDQRPEAVFER